MIEPKVNIAGNYEDFCEKITREILVLSNKKLKIQKRFTIVLSGGATPKGIYQRMASPAYRNRFQWQKIHFFWGDERWVSPDDPRSNFRMVSEALLTKVKIPPENIHPIATKKTDIKNAAIKYEETIRDFFKLRKGNFPSFDLILLGLGQDGHTASLFPGNPALLVKNHLAVPTSQKGIVEPRITLTLPVLNGAGMVFFLVSGDEKANIVHEVLRNEKGSIFPANKINLLKGKLSWFLDKSAAGQLPKTPQYIGVAADHGGYLLKGYLTKMLRKFGYEVTDFGDRKFDPDDDFPDFVTPLARAVARKEVDRGVAICGSGVGACIVANKLPGVRACMIHEKFSARQGVEDDDMNVICLGSKVLGKSLAWKLVTIFLSANFSNAQRYVRRLAKIAALEHQ